jgi:hypothetical protein
MANTTDDLRALPASDLFAAFGLLCSPLLTKTILPVWHGQGIQNWRILKSAWKARSTHRTNQSRCPLCALDHDWDWHALTLSFAIALCVNILVLYLFKVASPDARVTVSGADSLIPICGRVRIMCCLLMKPINNNPRLSLRQ